MRSLSTLVVLLVGLGDVFWASTANALGRRICAIIIFAALMLGASASNATLIGLDAFSGSEFVETFTGQTDANETGGPPLSNPFTLNGITYTSADTWRIQTSSSSLFDNISGASLAPTLNNMGGPPPTDLTIGFSTQINRAGLLLSSAGFDLVWDVTAFGVGLIPLETITVSQPGSNDAVFAGIERSEFIVSLGIIQTGGTDQGFNTFIDDIRIESVEATAPIPEPSTLALFAIGLTGLGFFGWRRRSVH